MAKRPISQRVLARLGLRSSNAAQRHKNKARSAKLPGKTDRTAQQRRAIKEQEH